MSVSSSLRTIAYCEIFCKPFIHSLEMFPHILTYMDPKDSMAV